MDVELYVHYMHPEGIHYGAWCDEFDLRFSDTARNPEEFVRALVSVTLCGSASLSWPRIQELVHAAFQRIGKPRMQVRIRETIGSDSLLLVCNPDTPATPAGVLAALAAPYDVLVLDGRLAAELRDGGDGPTTGELDALKHV